MNEHRKPSKGNVKSPTLDKYEDRLGFKIKVTLIDWPSRSIPCLYAQPGKGNAHLRVSPISKCRMGDAYSVPGPGRWVSPDNSVDKVGKVPHLGGAVLGLKKDLDIYSRSAKYLKSSCFSLELRVRDRPKQVIMGILYLP